MATSSEHTPLLNQNSPLSNRKRSPAGTNGSNSPLPLTNHTSSTTLTVQQSFRNLLFSSPLNLFLILVPLSFISHFAHWGAHADFFISFGAIIPLAGLLGDSTEQVSLKLGQTLGGLLNATFGNAVEAIVGILALVKGELRIVQTSMLGSILSNLLLVLGTSFLCAGFKLKESDFQVTAAQTSSSLMVLACTTLVIPAAYHSAQFQRKLENLPIGDESSETNDIHGLLTISRGASIVLLLMYMLYLTFQLKTHAYLYEAKKKDVEEEKEEMKMIPWTAGVSLLVITVLTAFCADYLVDSIDQFANDFGISKAFIGLILIPIVGNAAEHVTSIWMAMKDKMELTIGVSVGSSIQIAVGVIPLLVIIGWIIGQELTLYFENFETICLFISVLLVYLLIQDGKSNYMEGAMLISLYLIIALAFWVS